MQELTLLKSAIATASPVAELTLAPAQPFERILEGQDQLGLELGPDLHDYLRACDGQLTDDSWFLDDPIVPEYHYSDLGYNHFSNQRDDIYWTAAGWLIGIEKIVDFTQAFRESVLDENGSEYECFGPATLHDKYVYFLQTLNEYTLCIDHQPAAGGALGQVVSISSQSKLLAVVAPSLRHFFRMVAQGFVKKQFEKDAPDGYWRSSGKVL